MMHPRLFFLQCILVIVLINPAHLWASIYVYVDDEGVEHYTNAPTSNRYKLATFPRLNTPRSKAPSNQYSSSRRNSRGAYDSAQYDRQIQLAANTHKVDPLLIKAIIKAESDFDQYATSSKGAQGLMQLMPATARDLRVGNPYNPTQNINGGTLYFRKLLDVYEGDLARSLAAYNAGPGRVTRKGPLPRIRETVEYVQRVTRYYKLYKQTVATGASKQDSLHELLTVN